MRSPGVSCSRSGDVRRLLAENVRLTRALEQAETRNDLVLKATNDGVWDWDLVDAVVADYPYPARPCHLPACS